jgi:hypothetical protein
MGIQETIQALKGKYEDRGGIIDIGIGVCGINVYFDPDKRDDVIFQQVMNAGQPYGVSFKETKIKPEEAQRLAQEQIAPDADLGAIHRVNDEVVYCFYLPSVDLAKNYMLRDGKLVEYVERQTAE